MKRIIVITIIASLALLFLQCLWINNTYKSYHEAFEQKVDSDFFQSVSHEATCRADRKPYNGLPSRFVFKFKDDMTADEVDKYMKKDNDTINAVRVPPDSVIAGSSFQNAIMQIEQDILMERGIFIRLPLLDSIFTDISQLHNKRSIILFDEQNEIIERYGEELPAKNNIVCSKRYQIGSQGLLFVQIQVLFPIDQYLHDQIYILSIFALLIILIFTILLYQLTVIRKKDALLSARENTINGTIHDLKSPLSNIVPLLEWLGQGENDPKKKELLLSSKKKIKHLATDIDELLHIAKGASGKPIITIVSIPPEDLIQNALEKVSVKLLEKPYTINIINKLEKDTILCDRMYAENVLRNIIENSLKYSNDGVSITIKLFNDNRYDVIEISDTGWGINKKYLRKVFKQFYQIPSIAANGYGVGLSYVRSIMNAHGGKVAIESIFGTGTSVKCYFPSNIPSHE